jgi:hypothetical protein
MRADGRLVGLTHVLTVRPDVNTAYGLPDGTRTGFQFNIRCAVAVFDAPLTLTLHAILADGTHTSALVERPVHTVARDYDRKHFGFLLDANTVPIPDRKPAHANPPPGSAPFSTVSENPARYRPSTPFPATPRAASAAHPYRVRDFFTFRDTLFGRAIVEHAADDLPTVTLGLWDGSLQPVIMQNAALT